MDVNKRIAKWLGYEPHPNGIHWYRGTLKLIGSLEKLPNFLHSNAAAIELLPVLVEKNYSFTLYNNEKAIEPEYCFTIWETRWLEDHIADGGYKPTISEAICAAVSELIEREAEA